MLRHVLRFALAALVFASAAQVSAADPVCLVLKGKNLGPINGEPKSSACAKGSAGAIECLSYESSVTLSKDNTGRVTGVRAYAPVTCLKKIDKSSVPLLKALTSGEPIAATFYFLRPTGAGAPAPFLTVDFSDGLVVGIKQLQAKPSDPVSAGGLIEEVSFVFRGVRWTDVGTNLQVTDSWNVTKS